MDIITTINPESASNGTSTQTLHPCRFGVYFPKFLDKNMTTHFEGAERFNNIPPEEKEVYDENAVREQLQSDVARLQIELQEARFAGNEEELGRINGELKTAEDALLELGN